MRTGHVSTTLKAGGGSKIESPSAGIPQGRRMKELKSTSNQPSPKVSSERLIADEFNSWQQSHFAPMGPQASVHGGSLTSDPTVDLMLLTAMLPTSPPHDLDTKLRQWYAEFGHNAGAGAGLDMGDLSSLEREHSPMLPMLPMSQMNIASDHHHEMGGQQRKPKGHSEGRGCERVGCADTSTRAHEPRMAPSQPLPTPKGGPPFSGSRDANKFQRVDQDEDGPVESDDSEAEEDAANAVQPKRGPRSDANYPNHNKLIRRAFCQGLRAAITTRPDSITRNEDLRKKMTSGIKKLIELYDYGCCIEIFPNDLMLDRMLEFVQERLASLFDPEETEPSGANQQASSGEMGYFDLAVAGTGTNEDEAISMVLGLTPLGNESAAQHQQTLPRSPTTMAMRNTSPQYQQNYLQHLSNALSEFGETGHTTPIFYAPALQQPSQQHHHHQQQQQDPFSFTLPLQQAAMRDGKEGRKYYPVEGINTPEPQLPLSRHSNESSRRK
ncbi:hypothetical protein BP6252_13290 [Coleophoma cylindrospora]|uniref:Uncharacterized protein n=1 Tax=Coleophoma cylindrospora TaxID=1849047 RepID=A0A3D8QBH5_9HELO|nr:hypothetical protein BP6252_13290 [Coleophoma cylindrospora]